MFNETTGDLAAQKGSGDQKDEPIWRKIGCNPEAGGGCDQFDDQNVSFNKFIKEDTYSGDTMEYKDYYNEKTFWNGKYPRRGPSDDDRWSAEEEKAFGRTPFNQARSIDVYCYNILHLHCRPAAL